MAELTRTDPATDACCSIDTQASCCAADDKAGCCGPEHDAGTCGCAAGDRGLRDRVRDRYAATARATADSARCRSAAAVALTDACGAPVLGDALHDSTQTGGAPTAALAASLG